MSVVAFAEEVCWKGEVRRSSRKEIVFRVTSIGKIHGQRVDFELRASYDLWYDPEDAELIAVLEDHYPVIAWREFVFWKKLDHSAIAIMDPIEDVEVGSIVVRKRLGGDPSGEMDMTNVVSFFPRRLEQSVAESS
jgi:hypothetical protein